MLYQDRQQENTSKMSQTHSRDGQSNIVRGYKIALLGKIKGDQGNPAVDTGYQIGCDHSYRQFSSLYDATFQGLD
jgi:hypothetical protein